MKKSSVSTGPKLNEGSDFVERFLYNEFYRRCNGKGYSEKEKTEAIEAWEKYRELRTWALQMKDAILLAAAFIDRPKQPVLKKNVKAPLSDEPDWLSKRRQPKKVANAR